MSGATTLIAPVILLAGSSIVMNIAWYGHLKLPSLALWAAVLLAWGVAFVEYCLAVPANRIGIQAYSLAELKTIQEVASLLGFVLVTWVMFGQQPGLSQIVGFGLIAGGAFMIFKAPLG